MAYAAITNPGQFFNTVLYTGNNAANAITGVGFQPDIVWIKRRDNTADHQLYNSLAGVQKATFPNLDNAEATEGGTRGLNAFNTDGFTLGAEVSDIAGSCNVNGGTYASWNWKTGTTGSGSTTGSGTSKSYTYSVNTTSGVSIMRYEGNSTSGHTVPHHLGAAPKIVFNKETGGTSWWFTFVSALENAGKVLFLNDQSVESTQAASFNSTAPSSTVVTYGNDHDLNNNGQYYQAICFAEKKGFSQFGKYTGNASTDGPFIYTGFKPAWVVLKTSTTQTGHWRLSDNKRMPFNTSQANLFPSANAAENTSPTGNGNDIEYYSNGFKITTDNVYTNGNGNSFIYMAFAENPLVANVGDDGVPATAR